ncbi:MAG: hypothetical protein LC769_13200, partial [Chloroflexi bacterium]|nr:hypothetical protein [Chloroflexota bacterium]
LIAGVGAYRYTPAVRAKDVHWTANANERQATRPITVGRIAIRPYTPIRAPYFNRTGLYSDTPLRLHTHEG